MREERLLQRIRRWEDEPWRRGPEDPKRVIDSIVHHLQRLLNTRQGSVPIADDYGIPDFTHALQDGAGAALRIEAALRGVIEKYEPRLAAVRVRYMASDDVRLAFRFNIRARLAGATRPVFLETTVASGGKVEVKG